MKIIKPGFFMHSVICCLLLPVLIACTPAPDEPMRLASDEWLGYKPMYLAQKLGYIEKSDLHLIELTSASEALRHFRNGVIDAAALTLDEALLLLQDGYDVKVVLVMDVSHGGDAIIAREGIANMQALAGRRVGVEKNALGALMLSRALEVSGMSASDLAETLLLEYSEHENAFTQGKVDAVVTFEPMRSRLLKAGGHIIFDSSQIPGEIVDVLVVHSRYLYQHPDKVDRLIAAWFRGLEIIATKPDESLGMLASMVNLSVAEYRSALEGILFPDFAENLKLLSAHSSNKDEHSLARNITLLKKEMLKNKLLIKDIDTSSLLSSQPLLNAKKLTAKP